MDYLQGSHSTDANRCCSPPLRQVVSTWTRCGTRLAPRRAHERYTAEHPACARLVGQAYHRYPGRTTCRPPMPQLAHSRCLQNRPPFRAGAVPGTHASLAPSNADHRAPAYRLAPCRPFLLFWLCKTRLPASFHAIAGSIDWNNLSMMKEPVEQGGGENLIPREGRPIRQNRCWR